MRRAQGQASTEYVALLALVAVALAAGAALVGVGSWASPVGAAVRHGLCVLTAGVCSQAEAWRAGLAACPLSTRSDSRSAAATVVLVRLGREQGLVVERRSDGGVSVTVLEQGNVGAEAGVGVSFSPLGLRADARGSLGVGFSAGRSYDFADEDTAARFVKRVQERRSLGARVKRAAGTALCPLCRLLSGGDGGEPEPSARFLEGGGQARGTAALRGGALEAELTAAARVALGRSVARDGSVTYALTTGLEGTAAAGLFGAQGRRTRSAETVVEYTVSPRGEPRTLRVRSAHEHAGGIEGSAGASRGAVLDALELSSTTSSGRVLEAGGTLDLADPGDRRAAQALVSSLRPGVAPAAVARRMEQVRERIARHGTVDLRTYDTHEQGRSFDAGLALGARLGLAVESVRRGRALVDAYTATSGGPARERADCLEALRRRAGP